MNSDAKRRANAAHIQRLLDSGYRRKTFLLSPQALARLAELKAAHGSEAAALEHLLSLGPLPL